MSLNPYFGIALSLVGVSTALWLFDVASGPEAETSTLLKSALVESQDMPMSVRESDTEEERSLKGTHQIQLDLETTWDERCSAALDAGSEEFPVDAIVHRNFQLYQHGLLDPSPPGYSSSVVVSLMATSAPTDGHLNPAAAYLSHLGQVCGGVELTHPEQLSYQGVAQSGHEFSTVIFDPEGEAWRTFSAYAVPGYIVWVDGRNISTDHVREISARQVEILNSEEPFTRPLGHHVSGAVEKLRELTSSGV